MLAFEEGSQIPHYSFHGLSRHPNDTYNLCEMVWHLSLDTQHSTYYCTRVSKFSSHPKAKCPTTDIYSFNFFKTWVYISTNNTIISYYYNMELYISSKQLKTHHAIPPCTLITECVFRIKDSKLVAHSWCIPFLVNRTTPTPFINTSTKAM